MTTIADCARDFPDTPSIADGEELLRRIPSRHFVFDQRLGRKRLSSAAFEDDDDGDPMSVYRKAVIHDGGGSVCRIMAGHEGYGLAGLTAAQFRAKQQTVCAAPLPREPAHAQVCGPKPKSVCRSFARDARLEISPP